jgi:hypothetical protein
MGPSIDKFRQAFEQLSSKGLDRVPLEIEKARTSLAQPLKPLKVPGRFSRFLRAIRGARKSPTKSQMRAGAAFDNALKTSFGERIAKGVRIRGTKVTRSEGLSELDQAQARWDQDIGKARRRHDKLASRPDTMVKTLKQRDTHVNNPRCRQGLCNAAQHLGDKRLEALVRSAADTSPTPADVAALHQTACDEIVTLYTELTQKHMTCSPAEVAKMLETVASGAGTQGMDSLREAAHRQLATLVLQKQATLKTALFDLEPLEIEVHQQYSSLSASDVAVIVSHAAAEKNYVAKDALTLALSDAAEQVNEQVAAQVLEQHKHKLEGFQQWAVQRNVRDVSGDTGT